MPMPTRSKIYHIVHLDNLASIVADGCLWSDAIMSKRPSATVIGMGSIKRRRLGLPVSCHAGTHVGEYVPFYFCSRSVMLFVIHCANNVELAYRGGQQPIIHLEADLRSAIGWSEGNGQRWAFSLSNASAIYAQFRTGMANLREINWDAVLATDFRPADIKEGKQAELLIEHSFAWSLIERIGVYSHSVQAAVAAVLRGASHQPRVEIRRDWYY